MRGRALDTLLACEGGKLLAEILPLWAHGELEAHEQNHDVATFSQMFSKEDGLLNLVSGDPYQNLLKIRAFEGWPGTHAFFERPSTGSGQAGKRIRVQILDAHLDGNRLIIDRVKPEGKSEMSFDELTRSGAKPTLPD
jgi:methionyl-tRNA formyltransferase